MTTHHHISPHITTHQHSSIPLITTHHHSSPLIPIHHHSSPLIPTHTHSYPLNPTYPHSTPLIPTHHTDFPPIATTVLLSLFATQRPSCRFQRDILQRGCKSLYDDCGGSSQRPGGIRRKRQEESILCVPVRGGLHGKQEFHKQAQGGGSCRVEDDRCWRVNVVRLHGLL